MPEPAQLETTKPQKRGPYRTGVRRREQLLAVALDVFAEHGYAGGSLRAIAERAGVSHATLIQHFGSKEGLLIAVLEEWDRRTVADGLADVSGLDYFRRLPEVIAAHRDHRGLLELFTTIAAEASSSSHPARGFIEQRYARNLATLAGHLREAIDDGDIASMTDAQIQIEVRLVTAAMDGIGLQWLLDPSTDVDGSIATYIDRAISAWRRG
ncbi:TetR/AcrR family transcriptional regulator [Brachybacterium conglomeratum]|uniref:TetR/AcrR family transcriptional regulator n=1 Tax=Brachybacterium conglomeratum TaxID=47846 RepID=UPI003DA031B5